MEYRVVCACGKAQTVRGSDAGASLPCSCGQKVGVPALHILKREAGQASLSADQIIETMLKAGKLPEEKDCVLCARATTDSAIFEVTCEREAAKKENMGIKEFVVLLVFGFWWWLLWRSRNPRGVRVMGKDVIYPLPLRVCSMCAAELTSTPRKIDALRRVPLYDDLFQKYPRATVK